MATSVSRLGFVFVDMHTQCREHCHDVSLTLCHSHDWNVHCALVRLLTNIYENNVYIYITSTYHCYVKRTL
jgi:hypothetical protein